ncbi:MAG: hypothetical protein AAF423_05945 [Pseudomonadota bacterium]
MLVLSDASAFAQDTIPDGAFDERYSLPAVSEANGKISFGYSYVDTGVSSLVNQFPTLPIDPANAVFFTLDNSFEGAFVEASVSIPLSQDFGFQIDGLYSEQTGNPTGFDFGVVGVGGHLFWRDPDKGLVGIYGHYVQADDVLDTYQIGTEVELYHQNVSIELFAGWDTLAVELNPVNLASGQGEEFLAGEAVVAFYPEPDFRISVGAAHNFEETRFTSGIEWQLSDSSLSPSFFANGDLSENLTSLRAGLTFYFGAEPKSLIRRHREDDPQNRLQKNASALQACANGILSTQLQVPLISPVTGMPNQLILENSVDGCTLTPLPTR